MSSSINPSLFSCLVFLPRRTSASPFNLSSHTTIPTPQRYTLLRYLQQQQQQPFEPFLVGYSNTRKHSDPTKPLKMPSIRLLPPSTLRLLRASSTAPSALSALSSSSPSSPSSLPSTTTTTTRPYSSAFQNAPAPPRLPAEQQAEFERLQRAVADRFADPTPLPHEQPQAPSPAAASRHVSTPGGGGGGSGEVPLKAGAEEVATGGVWRGAPPEFEGDKNPKTGEVGGPKTEPLRWT
jgi:hypothetical protein